MKIFKVELKKTFLFEKGLLILVLCLVLEALLLLLIPKQIDSRIRISRKQYDRLLQEYKGETSAGKEEEILRRKAEAAEILNAYDGKLEEWNAGKITEEEWEVFSDRYRDAVLMQNALEIFAEKAEAFRNQETETPSWYFDDYGWDTVFLILKFPNIFLLVFVVYISVRCFQYEEENGMIPLICSSKCGWPDTFRAKFVVIILSSLAAALLFSVEEQLIFRARGFLENGSVPMGSIPCFYEYPSDLSLAEAFRTVTAARLFGTVTVSAAALCAGILIQRFIYSMTAAVIILAAPFVSAAALGKGLLYTWTGWLSGVDFLKLDYSSAGFELILGGSAVIVVTSVLLLFSVKKYRSGINSR